MSAEGIPRNAMSGVLRGVRLGKAGLEFSSAAVFELFEQLPVGISITLGPSHRFVYANRHYRDALLGGRDPKGVTLSDLGGLLPARTHAIRRTVLAEAASATLMEEPIPPLAAVPSNYWDVTFYPLIGESGEAEGILTFAVDVTARVKARIEAEQHAEVERRRAEDASLDRARLALAVEATGLGIWEWNVETGETIWSDRQKAIWGLGPDDPVSYEYWRDSIHLEDREEVLGQLDHTLDRQSGGEQRLEHRIVRPGGGVRWIASQGRMIYDERSGSPLRLIGTVQDVTRRKTEEEDLRQALETRELLLHEMNHRVKNSLQIVSSMLSVQSSRIADEHVRALIQEAQHRVQAVAALHDRLNRSSDFRTVDLGVYFEGLCSDLERTVAAGEDVKVSVSAECLHVSPERAVPLALILNELLTNAIKYAYPHGSGTIAVSLIRQDGGHASLCVEDDGVGLPEDYANRRHGSLGFRIIEGLTRQVGGEMTIVDRNPGTSITIQFDPGSGAVRGSSLRS